MEAKRILEASQGDVAALEATAKVGEHSVATLVLQNCLGENKCTRRVFLSSMFWPSLYVVKTALLYSDHLPRMMFLLQPLHATSMTDNSHNNKLKLSSA